MGDIVRVVRGGRFIGWYIRYKDADGRRKQRASHQPTRELARRYLVEVEARVARGLVGIPEPAAPAPTVAALVERFLCEYSRPRIRDLERYRRNARTALRRVLPLCGERPADSLAAGDIERLRQALGRRHAPNSVRLSLAFLATAFAWAVRLGLVPASPLRGVELPSQRELIEYLGADEVRRLLATACERAAAGAPAERMRHACLHLAIHTGLRKGELFGLRWRDLDLDGRRLSVARSYRALPKGGKGRHLRLPDAAVPVLAAWRATCPPTAEGLVFPILAGPRPRLGTHSDMLDLAQLIAEAGCPPLRRPWHALRHTFASHYVMAGGNILTLQRILGHSDIKMTLGYAHLAPDFLGDEMNRVKF